MIQAKPLLRRLFDAAVAAADPARVLPPALPARRDGVLRVVGAGKAAASMAAALDARWDGALSGFVVTRYGHGMPAGRIEVREAAHPLPDGAALDAGAALLAAAREAGLRREALAVLLSGGASALACAPPPGVSLADKAALMRALLRCGADIGRINCVRRHLSLLKGGRLAVAAYPAPVICYAISDVPGDDPATIGSGPCVADPTTVEDAREVLRAHGIAPPASVVRWFEDPRAESPKPGDPRLAGVDFRLVATPAQALEAAAACARDAGYEAVLLGDALDGEARDLGFAHAQLALARAGEGRRCVLISGGETTVTVRGDGRGGRNAEYLLALFAGLRGAGGIAALAADTDGIDGTEDNAGACFDESDVAQAQARGLSPQAWLETSDSHGFFATLGTLVHSGPTRTNVNDFRAILVHPAAG